MYLRQIVAALLLIGAIFAQPSVWLAFGLLLAGYDLGSHMALPITAAINSLTEFGLGRWTGLTISFVVELIGLCFECAAVLIIARALRTTDETLPPPWYGAAVGYVVLPGFVLSAIVVLAGAVITPRAMAGTLAYGLRTWLTAIEFIVQLALILPTCLAVARASGDRATGVATILRVERPPVAAWVLATLATIIALLLLVAELRSMASGVGLLPWTQTALWIALNALFEAIGTTVRIAIAVALYRSVKTGPVRLGEWFA